MTETPDQPDDDAGVAPATPRSWWPRLGLGSRLFAAMALVVVTGAGTLLVVSLLVAPAVFMNHLGRAGAPDLSPAVTTHVNMAFTQATLIALGTGTLTAAVAAGLVAWLVARRIASPVTDLAAVTGRLANGVYDAKAADPRLGPEFTALAASVNQLGAQLSMSEDTRRRLLSDLGHQLRTPIASLEATVEAIGDRVLPMDDETSATLTDQVARLHRLVADIESVSRAEERQLALNPRPTPATELAHRAAAVLLPQFRSAGIGLEVRASEPGPTVVVDADRIVEALLNVLDNALRHTSAGGVVVRVEGPTTDSEDRVWADVVVEDTGEGFTPDQAPLLFQRFYRAAAPPSGAPAEAGPGRHGSGIGLTIARAIVDAHHGSLTAHSDGPGRGAAFTLTLPAVR
jgi:signal transduction histidine kinase